MCSRNLDNSEKESGEEEEGKAEEVEDGNASKHLFLYIRKLLMITTMIMITMITTMMVCTHKLLTFSAVILLFTGSMWMYVRKVARVTSRGTSKENI